MSNAIYRLGTDELVEFEISCATVGFVFDPADWTLETLLVEINDEYDPDTAVFTATDIVEDDGHVYGQVALEDLLDPVALGIYHVVVRAVPDNGALRTPLVRALGHVEVKGMTA